MMLEIDKELVKKWGYLKDSEVYFPYSIDIPCPNNKCGRSLVNCPLVWQYRGYFASMRVTCASCDQEIYFFIIDPPKAQHPDDIAKCRILIIPPQTVDLPFSDEIIELSPDFARIYTQASQAELSRLDELVGMGYRKALEFLIKDYLCGLHPEEFGEIKAKFLGRCIKDYVTDPRVLDCAERTVWLANDETHYVRKWDDHDIKDLKMLLMLTIYWISSELLTRKYQKDMTRG